MNEGNDRDYDGWLIIGNAWDRSDGDLRIYNDEEERKCGHMDGYEMITNVWRGRL